MRFEDAKRPFVSSSAANLTDASTQSRDVPSRMPSLSMRGRLEISGLAALSLPRKPHTICVGAPPPP